MTRRQDLFFQPPAIVCSARRVAASFLVILGAIMALPPAADARVVHRERSLYSTIIVDRQGPVICMQFSVRRDQRNQSCLNERRPREMLFPYTRMMMTSLLVKPAPRRALTIGLGGGTLPLALDELYPELVQDVVEIDPAVTQVARDWFGFKPSDRVRVIEQDGRVFAKRARTQRARTKDAHYDLILLDAFNGDYIPEHLMTREFLEEIRDLLAPGGVVVANTFSISRLYDAESATYAAVFGDFLNLKPWDSGNRVIIATNGALPDGKTLAERAALLGPSLKPYGIRLDELLPVMKRERDWPADATVLTDQYAPANLLQTQ
ncbi:MAG: spermidine synthase [Pseudomonadales bacterium]